MEGSVPLLDLGGDFDLLSLHENENESGMDGLVSRRLYNKLLHK